ncbi:hypothetical protein CC80DRAFT_550554 [Byssothecium circinans]|uniref:Uncharacterized protein n=1 Tax=Byssothecium circinans TaxID=147558 RepID=A0A6A5TR08_9PLEO|nr:hypothetical protein CC80DRAFT_550554 [Byssothecium circinans]
MLVRAGQRFFALRHQDKNILDLLRAPTAQACKLPKGGILYFAIPIPVHTLEQLSTTSLMQLHCHLEGNRNLVYRLAGHHGLEHVTAILGSIEEKLSVQAKSSATPIRMPVCTEDEIEEEVLGTGGYNAMVHWINSGLESAPPFPYEDFVPSPYSGIDLDVRQHGRPERSASSRLSKHKSSHTPRVIRNKMKDITRDKKESFQASNNAYEHLLNSDIEPTDADPVSSRRQHPHWTERTSRFLSFVGTVRPAEIIFLCRGYIHVVADESALGYRLATGKDPKEKILSRSEWHSILQTYQQVLGFEHHESFQAYLSALNNDQLPILFWSILREGHPPPLAFYFLRHSQEDFAARREELTDEELDAFYDNLGFGEDDRESQRCMYETHMHPGDQSSIAGSDAEDAENSLPEQKSRRESLSSVMHISELPREEQEKIRRFIERAEMGEAYMQYLSNGPIVEADDKQATQNTNDGEEQSPTSTTPDSVEDSLQTFIETLTDDELDALYEGLLSLEQDGSELGWRLVTAEWKQPSPSHAQHGDQSKDLPILYPPGPQPQDKPLHDETQGYEDDRTEEEWGQFRADRAKFKRGVDMYFRRPWPKSKAAPVRNQVGHKDAGKASVGSKSAGKKPVCRHAHDTPWSADPLPYGGSAGAYFTPPSLVASSRASPRAYASGFGKDWGVAPRVGTPRSAPGSNRRRRGYFER